MFLDFQKVFPRAKNAISQSELVKADIIKYNRKIIELNTELQMLPERCPHEVSSMCDMISGYTLVAENYTYLVRPINTYIINNKLISYFTLSINFYR